MLLLQVSELLAEAEALNVHGLMFQHIALCETRAWLHYYRIDCAHLNRHIQAGILLHETAYEGEASQPFWGFGIHPDCLDNDKREVSEVKKSKSHESASIAQLRFYLAVLVHTTQQEWSGVLRYPKSRRIKRIVFDVDAQTAFIQDFERIKQVIACFSPPAKIEQPLCQNCSYRIVCWQKSTEDWDY
ncbi:Dna2/Cas4 domain-containing protein [Thioflexithrix psekupsensis]|uniref:DUF83 domain-containing protein n=1 Tax=Thioflexithrix psekupsensis TaxID=1570016 RepID=A0A251X5Q5_9GAMM|nr:Dna2/Cas4 domain-containing protein [Thioflexithrix psekupsensis]OUD13075.1 hypothetical protein TPSD3_10515 [Thioflexithrix psekupsensis]